MTCQHRYTSIDFGGYSGCLVNNGCGPASIDTVRGHLTRETARLGRLPTFDEVDGCPAHEKGPPVYVERVAEVMS